MMFIQTISGVLHGIGKTRSTVIAMFIGIIVKLISNILLIPVNNIYEKGAVIANLFSNIVTFIILWNVLKKNIKLKFNMSFFVVKPLISSIIMAILSYKLHLLLISYGMGENINIIITISTAIFIYGGMILILKTFSIEELKKFLKR